LQLVGHGGGEGSKGSGVCVGVFIAETLSAGLSAAYSCAAVRPKAGLDGFEQWQTFHIGFSPEHSEDLRV
jgi:hypothetical protein